MKRPLYVTNPLSGPGPSRLSGWGLLTVADLGPAPLQKPRQLTRFPAGSFFGGFRTPALVPQPPLALGRHPKPFPGAVL
jgi:hypothetical protein